jgi:hypothetical protein
MELGDFAAALFGRICFCDALKLSQAGHARRQALLVWQSHSCAYEARAADDKRFASDYRQQTPLIRTVCAFVDKLFDHNVYGLLNLLKERVVKPGQIVEHGYYSPGPSPA